MSGDDDRLALLVEFEEEVDDVGSIVRIEIPGRFISDDNLGIVDERSSDTDTLCFSSGESLDEGFFLMEESDSRENLGEFLEDVGILVSAHLHSEGDIFADGFGAEELIILEHNSNISPVGEEFLFAKCVHIFAMERECPGLGPEVSDEHLDETRFTTPRSADEEDEFSRFDFDIHILEDIFVPIPEGDIFYTHMLGYEKLCAHCTQKEDFARNVCEKCFFVV